MAGLGVCVPLCVCVCVSVCVCIGTTTRYCTPLDAILTKSTRELFGDIDGSTAHPRVPPMDDHPTRLRGQALIGHYLEAFAESNKLLCQLRDHVVMVLVPDTELVPDTDRYEQVEEVDMATISKCWSPPLCYLHCRSATTFAHTRRIDCLFVATYLTWC
jgi:hypothetical protein